MDIKRAKQEIERTVKAYLAKDEGGNYLIPALRQRPILLMGPPGVGKTQIVEQAARNAVWRWWHTPSPTTPGKAPWVCPLSGSGISAARPSASPSTP